MYDKNKSDGGGNSLKELSKIFQVIFLIIFIIIGLSFLISKWTLIIPVFGVVFLIAAIGFGNSVYLLNNTIWFSSLLHFLTIALVAILATTAFVAAVMFLLRFIGAIR